MSRASFGDAECSGKRKQTRRELFLAEMERIVPWKLLLDLIEPFYPVAGHGCRPYPLETMPRVSLTQNRFALNDPAMEGALYEITPMRTFARLSLTNSISDKTTILNFRHRLTANDPAAESLSRVNAYVARKCQLLKRGSIVDATIIAAPSSTKNTASERNPEMHQTKKGNQWRFGMKAHIGVDADSGLTHTVTTPANEPNVEQVEELLHARVKVVHADADYAEAQKTTCGAENFASKSRPGAGVRKRKRTGARSVRSSESSTVRRVSELRSSTPSRCSSAGLG